MHDITKVFEAISKTKENNAKAGGIQSYFNKEYFVKVFAYESFRTFSDRFLNQEDKSHFKDLLAKSIETHLAISYNDTLMKDQRDCIFIDPFMEPNENGIIEKKIKPYEEITEFDELKKLILSKINHYINIKTWFSLMKQFIMYFS